MTEVGGSLSGLQQVINKPHVYIFTIPLTDCGEVVAWFLAPFIPPVIIRTLERRVSVRSMFTCREETG